jgi:hypothetical protein
MDPEAKTIRQLAWAHYAVAAVTALMALPFILALCHGTDGIGQAVLPGNLLRQMDDLEVPPELIDQMMGFLMVSTILMILLHATVVAWVGWCIAGYRRYWVVFIFSLLDCTYIPFGTVIGVWAVVMLSRPSVKARFGLNRPATRANAGNG